MAVVTDSSGKSCRGLRLLRRRWNTAGSERQPHARLQIDNLSVAVGSFQQPLSYWIYASVKHFHIYIYIYVTLYFTTIVDKEKMEKDVEFYRKRCRCVLTHWASVCSLLLKLLLCLAFPHIWKGDKIKNNNKKAASEERSRHPTVWPRRDVLVPLSDITRGQSPKLRPVEHRGRWSWQAVQVTRTFTFGNIKFNVWLLLFFFKFESSIVVVNYFSNWGTFFHPKTSMSSHWTWV